MCCWIIVQALYRPMGCYVVTHKLTFIWILYVFGHFFWNTYYDPITNSFALRHANGFLNFCKNICEHLDIFPRTGSHVSCYTASVCRALRNYQSIWSMHLKTLHLEGDLEGLDDHYLSIPKRHGLSLQPVTSQPFNPFNISFTSLPPFLPSSCLLTRELQSEALLAGEEVCGKLQADSVESAVGVRGQRWTTQLSQQDPSVLGPIPDAKHIVDLLRVENQEMQAVKDKDKIRHLTLHLTFVCIIWILNKIFINNKAGSQHNSQFFKM